jgi:murein L,D-transpeptidase YcbB/YkuD
MLTGQLDPREVSEAWHIDPQQTDVDSAVARILREARFDQALAALRPQNPDYELLRRELARFREIVAAGGWGATVPAGPSLKPGQRAPAARLQALRTRLEKEGLLALGDEPAPQGASPATAGEAQRRQDAGGDARDTSRGARAASGSVYDGQLAGAVAQFQARHGIVVDSILGEETVTSLNVPADYRLAQIAANLERHRWLPRTLGARYVVVNVPAFRLEAFEGGKPTLTMNVVVGAEFNDQSTPTFADSMSYVVFRPYWNVPENIAEEEIYPKAAADPGYFAARNYEEVTENGKTRVRQKPGGDNALGLVKFMFPNQFAIYLHDTPEKALFQQDVRAASHGCIRLEKPDELAQWVLGWDAARVRQAMESGEDDVRVDLERKVPVYIAYFTAYARDGQLYFGNDVYDRDRSIVQAIARGAQPDSATAQAVRALRELAAD